MKLQKLIYIANGIHLALNEGPLINEPVETWDYGPVIHSVYQNYKMFGSTRISVNPFENLVYRSKLSETAKKAIDDAWVVGKDVDGIQLSNWTHKEDSPWTTAKDQKLAVIPNNEMKNYFMKFLGKK
ncbi:Panacea domain-containing protein [Pedobacter psychrodurus]|nr:type II toxin-antitoxin system antitoxin SocA domain-containing protein [Pedobacter psychrodurus]